MLVGFQMDQAKLGKETQFALREKEDEARHWRKLYAEATGGGKEGSDAEAEGTGDGDEEEGAGALGVDERVKLRAEVRRRGGAEGGKGEVYSCCAWPWSCDYRGRGGSDAVDWMRGNCTSAATKT